MKNVLGIILSYVYIGIVIVLAKLFEKLGKEASRKFIHIMLGNWWLIAMFLFDNWIWASFVPMTFVIINYISYKKGIISVMERDSNKEGLGTVYYAISLLIITIVTIGIFDKPVLGIVPVFTMAYGDGLAAVIGKLVKSKKIKIKDSEKSIAGCLTMFIVTFIISAIYLVCISNPMWLIISIVISMIATIVELVSIKGLDNITVPLITMIMLLVINM